MVLKARLAQHAKATARRSSSPSPAALKERARKAKAARAKASIAELQAKKMRPLTEEEKVEQLAFMLDGYVNHSHDPRGASKASVLRKQNKECNHE